VGRNANGVAGGVEGGATLRPLRTQKSGEGCVLLLHLLLVQQPHALVVVIHGHTQHLLRVLLAYHVLVQHLEHVAGRRDVVLGPAGLVVLVEVGARPRAGASVPQVGLALARPRTDMVMPFAVTHRGSLLRGTRTLVYYRRVFRSLSRALRRQERRGGSGRSEGVEGPGRVLHQKPHVLALRLLKHLARQKHRPLLLRVTKEPRT
jgi:hypothetical protein